MPRFALAALAFGALACVLPIVGKYVERARWPSQPPLALAAAARIGYLLLFIAAAIHLTNMRITPLIYFKF